MSEKVFIDETEKCPRCGSREIEGGSATFDGPDAYQECSCHECSYAWTDCYAYSHSVAESLPEPEEDEIKRRVFELGRWPLPCFPHAKDPDEVTVLECFSQHGELVCASVRVRGLGYSINFEECSYARNTAWDEETR